MEINNLPPELLVTIFQHLSKEDLIWTIHNVCTYWRHVAQAGNLWTYLDVNRLVIENHGKQKSLLKYLLAILIHVQYVKSSSDRLLPLLLKSKDTLRNIRRIDLVPTTNSSFLSSKELFNGLRAKCPNLNALRLKFYSVSLSVLNQVFDLNLKNVTLIHEQNLGNTRDISSRGNREMETVAILLKEKANEIRKTKRIELHSFSSDFLAPVLELNLSNLTRLTAFGNFIKDSTIHTILFPKTNITELCLDFSNITDQSLNEIAETATNLRYLSLKCCSRITDKGIVMVTKSCKKLERLNIRNSMSNGRHFASNLSLGAIAPGCTSLKNVSVQYLSTFDIATLTALTQSCRMLTSLSFNDCCSLSDASLEVIGQNCPVLFSADFSQCPEITLDGVRILLTRCLAMENISCMVCDGITNFSQSSETPPKETATEVLRNEHAQHGKDTATLREPDDEGKLKCSQLRNFNLSYCYNLEPEALIVISELCRNLRMIILRFCEGPVNDVNVDILRCVFTNCCFLEYILVGPGLNSTVQRKDILI
ncbi:F-box/LRR-repeat protein 7-like [Mytilus californianus]|uniref:F-box/LRR-repeat protein 7-like n=1 Tax=Mytilus californianus TaxID=6549 RepID=UPI00224631BC|nr:F-box/LRR-repeat protein 7-like [Mytilus californianus]